MTEFKKDEKAIKFNRDPTVVDLSLGTLKFKSLSMKDSLYVLNLLKGELSAKDFTIKFFFNQMLDPKMDFEAFKEISDKELLFLASQFIKDEYSLSKVYKEIYGEIDITYVNFEELIDKYLQSIFNSIVSSTTTISSFSRSFPVIPMHIFQITPLTDFSSLIKESSEQFRKLTLMGSYHMPLVNLAKQFQYTENLLKRVIEPQIEIWKRWAIIHQETFKEFIDQQKKFVDKYAIDVEVANTCLKQYQWFITPVLSIDFIYEVISICDKDDHKREEINELYYEYFSSDDFLNLDEMVEEWKSKDVLRHTRIKIIESSVNLLKTADSKINPSYLIVPTLMTQIEGIEHELMEKRELTPKGGRWFDSDDKVVKREDFYENEDLNFILDSAKSILLEVIYQSVYPGSSLGMPINFNRHKIAHGEFLNYGTKYNVIRCFLILDFIIRVYASD